MACPCGLFVKRRRVPRHIFMCKLDPCPLATLRGHIKEIQTMRHVDAEKRVTCPECQATVKTGNKATVAKALATNFAKKHKNMSAGARDRRRRAIFRKGHVLVARNVSAAVATGLQLDGDAYDDIVQAHQLHGTPEAQATAPTRTCPVKSSVTGFAGGRCTGLQCCTQKTKIPLKFGFSAF